MSYTKASNNKVEIVVAKDPNMNDTDFLKYSSAIIQNHNEFIKKYLKDITPNQNKIHHVEQIGISDDIENKNIDETKEKALARRREQHKIAKSAIWTDEMFKDAKKKLYKNVRESKDIKTPYVNTPCQLWQGCCQEGVYHKGVYQKGYGTMHMYGKNNLVHVLACEIKNKQHKPKGLVVRHLCAVRNCVNPDHVVLGTYQENARDTLIHGNNLIAKLSNEEVLEIRKNKDNDGLTQVARAAKYKICVNTLHKIEKNITYRHLL
jgi:hypothetical protein